MTPLRINLVYDDNGAGIPRDARVIAGVLEQLGAELSHSPLAARPAIERIAAQAGKWRGRPRYDLNIFLEQIRPAWFAFARRNLLVPNQEWFSATWIGLLPRFSLILCKSREGESRFRAAGGRVSYVGFTSSDQRMPDAVATRPGALHVAGRSIQKGTEAVLRIWQRHPEWPVLTVVQRPPHPGHPLWHPVLPNVTYHSEYLEDARIRELQNSHWLHVRPSEAEGFGHPFAESMSCGAVVITTDAAPMNELIQPDRGILVPARPVGPQGIGVLHQVDEAALEQAIEQALGLGTEERARLGRNARNWFEANQRAFRERFLAAVTSQV